MGSIILYITQPTRVLITVQVFFGQHKHRNNIETKSRRKWAFRWKQAPKKELRLSMAFIWKWKTTNSQAVSTCFFQTWEHVRHDLIWNDIDDIHINDGNFLIPIPGFWMDVNIRSRPSRQSSIAWAPAGRSWGVGWCDACPGGVSRPVNHPEMVSM